MDDRGPEAFERGAEALEQLGPACGLLALVAVGDPGHVHVEQQDRVVGKLGPGDCFGESSYVLGARRTATIRAADTVALICVSSSLLEQASSACQLRFNKVFLRTLIRRLQSAERLDLEVQ